MNRSFLASFLMLFVLLTSLASAAPRHDAEQRIVKLYGEGGFGGLEAYQTGLLTAIGDVRSSDGWILTVDSPALGGDVLVVLATGDRYNAQRIAADAHSELALLKIDLSGSGRPVFDLLHEAKHPVPDRGTTLFALSNPFNIAQGPEPLTMQRGVLLGTGPIELTRLLGRTHAQERLLLDLVTSNPGAAGGAVVDPRGRLLGMIGKERRARRTGTWINHALPTRTLLTVFKNLTSGKVADATSSFNDTSLLLPGELLARWGLAFIPAITERTPPLVEYIRHASDADQAGLRIDDLVVSIHGVPVSTRREAQQQLIARLETGEPTSVTLLRDGQRIVTTMESQSE